MTWIEDQTQVYPSQYHGDHCQIKKLLAMLKEKTRPDDNFEFIAISK
jgi:hypothetical protein